MSNSTPIAATDNPQRAIATRRSHSGWVLLLLVLSWPASSWPAFARSPLAVEPSSTGTSAFSSPLPRAPQLAQERFGIAALVGTVSAGFAARPALAGGSLGGRRVPLAEAGVYAYRVTDLAIHRAQTDQVGGFTFAALPAGVYKLIVHKSGFLPAVVLVTRTTASAFQELQLELFPDSKGVESGENADFWQIRKRIPADVLRQIEVADALHRRDHAQQPQAPEIGGPFTAQMYALTGSGDYAQSRANVVGGHVDLAGQVGELDLGLTGNFRTLESKQDTTLGKAKAIVLKVSHDTNGSFNVSSRLGSIVDQDNPIDLERYGVGWSGRTGAGRTAISANYTAETNYYRDPRADLFEVPGSSQTIDIEGTYNQQLGRNASVETGVRYRDRGPSSLSQRQGLTGMSAISSLNSERVDLFGLGDISVKPSLSLRYGLFTTAWNGAYAFAPEGGLVFDLPRNWTAETSFRRRLYESADQWTPDFLPTHHRQRFECTTAEDGCYRLRLSRDLGERGTFEVGALYRDFADTIRLYFSDDLFDDLDSVFLVDGDRLPEIHVAFSRRISPNVMTRFASNVARGGGGSIGTDLENEVRYLVTSFQGEFERSETGVTLSFHSLEQRLLDQQGFDAQDPIAKDRVQLHITQGLPGLMGFGQDLNLILDMQVSRGDKQRLAQASNDELSRRILGGIALRF